MQNFTIMGNSLGDAPWSGYIPITSTYTNGTVYNTTHFGYNNGSWYVLHEPTKDDQLGIPGMSSACTGTNVSCQYLTCVKTVMHGAIFCKVRAYVCIILQIYVYTYTLENITCNLK